MGLMEGREAIEGRLGLLGVRTAEGVGGGSASVEDCAEEMERESFFMFFLLARAVWKGGISESAEERVEASESLRAICWTF